MTAGDHGPPMWFLRRFAEHFADAALGGGWARAEIAERLAAAGLEPGDAETLAPRLLVHAPTRPLDPGQLSALIRGLPTLAAPVGQPVTAGSPDPAMAWRWAVPQWQNAGQLADAMDLYPGELDWFADIQGRNRHAPAPLRHYRALWLPTGAAGVRLIEAPKPRLAELQRRLARRVLAALPVHDAAHGFRPGRSPTSFAAPHAGRAMVLRLDLAGFFTTITGARTRGLLRRAGYPAPVAATLAGLLTVATAPDVLARAPAGPSGSAQAATRWRMLGRLAQPHLPQGAPSSPALANAIAYRLDRRLSGLAAGLSAHYTRYADDLAFSGDANLPLHRLLPGARRIVTEEGFRIRADKTRITAAHQSQRLAGLVVNHAPAVARRDYDALRALLHNCATTSVAEQHDRSGWPGSPEQFRAHLLGRIGWVSTNRPDRGRKLRELFDRITW